MNEPTAISHNAQPGSPGAAIFTGILLILLGCMALGTPILMGMSVAIMVGVSLIIGGISLLVFGFRAGLGIWPYVFGLLAVVTGIYLTMNPAVAAATLTMFVCGYLLFAGFSEVALAFQIKPREGWGWMLFNGVLSIILSAMLWSQFPLSGPMAIGILIGIKLLFSGVAVMMLGFAAKKLGQSQP